MGRPGQCVQPVRGDKGGDGSRWRPGEPVIKPSPALYGDQEWLRRVTKTGFHAVKEELQWAGALWQSYSLSFWGCGSQQILGFFENKICPFTSLLLFSEFSLSVKLLFVHRRSGISLASSWWRPYLWNWSLLEASCSLFAKSVPRSALPCTRHPETRKLHHPWKWPLENYSRLLGFENTIHHQNALHHLPLI